jgi:hypothetical protein
VIKHLGVAAPGLAPELHEHPDQGRSLRQAGCRQDQVGDERVIAAPAPEREQSLEDRESRAGGEDPERREQRPEVPLLAVAERVPSAGCSPRRREARRNAWLRVSATECAASASMALEPTRIPAPSLITPTNRFAAPAMRAVRRAEECPDMRCASLPWQVRQKESLVRRANIMAILGLVTVGLAISAAVLLVVSYVDKGLPVVITTAFIVFVFAGLWFALPLARRIR